LYRMKERSSRNLSSIYDKTVKELAYNA